MSYAISIQNDKAYSIPSVSLRQSASLVLKQHDVDKSSELTIVLTDNPSMRALNQQHRHVDAPTDVLSFPADPLPDFVSDEPPYLGDIVIAIPYAKAQADKHLYSFDDSLCLLVIHGILHLLGYDHDTPENRAKMWSAQEKALDEMKIDPAIVPRLESYAHD